jgi:transposase InsO family protein
MVELYTQHIVPHYGIPTKIISDHDPRLTAKLFKELCNAFGVRRNMSTAYHPQTDGQSERTNQTLEMFLRIFCNHQQNDWAKLLPVAQYALNARQSATTKKAPFEALIGYIPPVHQHVALTRFQNIED